MAAKNGFNVKTAFGGKFGGERVNIQHQITNSPFLSLYFSYSSSGENLLIYQEISSCMIISLNLMTSLIE